MQIVITFDTWEELEKFRGGVPAVTQIQSVPSAEMCQLAAQFRDSLTKPVFAHRTSPWVSLSSIRRRNQLEMVIPSGCCSVAVVVQVRADSTSRQISFSTAAFRIIAMSVRVQ